MAPLDCSRACRAVSQPLAAGHAVGVDEEQLDQAYIGGQGEEIASFLNVGKLHGGVLDRMGRAAQVERSDTHAVTGGG